MDLAASRDLEEGGAVLVAVGAGTEARQLILLRVGGVAAAYVNACPHMGIMLDWVAERITAPGRRWLRCTAHGALFRREDGVCVSGPCAGQGLLRVPVTERGGRIMLEEAS
ncbi:Rieske 2Fe-2S domain-containing protein (plasmid) [Skermanella sp. TT6]|uniref:Rieske 2Fe-2S domain-containing protein n=1 Tax=Skermanella cutis TaxID=2775420 RepID=A0ABX7BF87_9PROT|nr:Rieske 2Fe-2S domain-containing protein [Skermanella sp. TT6]QQP92809.1 Rieske 2Fe-2S domain-containing protein [Skermanella sp. TT6]